ncbi:sugar phosphate isomerase/epimerase family protein [Pelagibacterium montanilacus]|uniref:sugar phosphate isomerase/epimerase family protein n=1 Tax=Pelagibacterium montanilacus TaxID=2185280 RepID=UPI000F8F6A83|nr:sugar phosphate isomerase/epimerase family protein [Pelagibacterium montanilacus]
MKLSLCNEVLTPMTLREQCAFAKGAGYDGLEIAPFTLGEDPTALDAERLARVRQTVEEHDLVVTSLHWLMMAPEGIGLTSLDEDVRAFTRSAMLSIVDIGAALGARVLVLGSPAQRRIDSETEDRQREIAAGHLKAIGDRAAASGLVCCLEAINSVECNFINRIEQARDMIARADSRGLGLMLDVSHSAQEENTPLADLARQMHAAGELAHVQLNAINRRAPGQSTDPEARDDIVPLISALLEVGYDGALAMEPFEYVPNGPGAAAFAAGYVRGLMAVGMR